MQRSSLRASIIAMLSAPLLSQAATNIPIPGDVLDVLTRTRCDGLS
jgi:hypothetical protein